MRIAVMAAVAAAALMSGACSAKHEPSNPETTPETTRTGDGSATAVTTAPAVHGGFAECLHANGVPDSAGPAAVLGRPDGVDPGTWERAVQACSTLAPGPAQP